MKIKLILLLPLFMGFAAHADDWGCQVLLCMSNPKGPEAVEECKPPMGKLWRTLNQVPPGTFPICDLVGSNGGTRAEKSKELSRYEHCPAGFDTSSPDENIYHGQSAEVKKESIGNFFGTLVNTLRVDGKPVVAGENQLNPAQSGGEGICVSGLVGKYVIDWQGYGVSNYQSSEYTVYQNVIPARRHGDGIFGSRYVDVYIDGVFNNRVWY